MRQVPLLSDTSLASPGTRGTSTITHSLDCSRRQITRQICAIPFESQQVGFSIVSAAVDFDEYWLLSGRDKKITELFEGIEPGMINAVEAKALF